MALIRPLSFVAAYTLHTQVYPLMPKHHTYIPTRASNRHKQGCWFQNPISHITIHTHIHKCTHPHILKQQCYGVFPLALTLASLACSIDRLTHIHRYMPLLMCEYTLTHTSAHSSLQYKHTERLAQTAAVPQVYVT